MQHVHLVVQKGMGDEEGGWGQCGAAISAFVGGVGAGTVALLTMATTWRWATGNGCRWVETNAVAGGWLVVRGKQVQLGLRVSYGHWFGYGTPN